MGREMHAIGDAELHQNSQAIYGDRIDFDMLNNKLHAIGNTRIEHNGNVFTGPELQLQLDERVGEMKEPVFLLKLPSKLSAPSADKVRPAEFARGDAKTMLFEGPTKETLKNVRYTTCEEGVDDWFLKAKDMEIDHYTDTATATHASMEFKGVPILYTPWIDFPLNKERKSGFLAPTFGTSTGNGIEFMLPYYWNIAPDMDATLSPRYLALRGLQLNGEFRYLESNYSGKDILEYLPSDDVTHTTRYYANLTHAHDFGNGLSGGFNYQRLSDSNYFANLSTQIINTSTVNMPQQAYLNYARDGWNLNGLVEQYQTLDNASFPYQRLPQLTLTRGDDWGTRQFSRWAGSGDDLQNDAGNDVDRVVAHSDFYGQWVTYGRSSHAPNTLPTGSRLTLHPSISFPITPAYGYLTPKLGVVATKYDLGGNTRFTNAQGLPDNYRSALSTIPVLSVDSGLYFDRNFKVVKNEYLQTLEPRLFYVYAPFVDQSRQPIFDTGLSDFKTNIFSENLFSGGDRFNDANQLTMALTSRILDSKTGEQRLSGTLGQRFYFSDQKVVMPGTAPRTSNSSDLLGSATANLRNKWNLSGGFQYDTDQSQFLQHNITAHYAPVPGKILDMSYRAGRARGATTDNQRLLDAYTEWPISGRWIGLGQITYSLLPSDVHKLGQATAGVEYNAGCWQGRAVVQRIPPATLPTPTYALYFQLELGGLASIGTSPLELIKRNIPGYINSSWIPDTNY